MARTRSGSGAIRKRLSRSADSRTLPAARLQDSVWLIFAYEPLIRLGAFAAVFAGMAVWELIAPRRSKSVSASRRWPNSLGLTAINTLAVRVLFPTAAVGFAFIAQDRGCGLLNSLDFPQGVRVALAIFAPDLALYAQHVMFHSLPLLCGFTACIMPITTST